MIVTQKYVDLLNGGRFQKYRLRGTFKMRPLQLKVQSCKLYNKKYVIASKQITNTDIFAFIVILILKLLSRKVLFINRKDNKNC